MSEVNLKCPVPRCDFQTGPGSEMVAVALLAAHTTVHSAPQSVYNGPKLDRPHVDIGVSAEEWKLFESRWSLYTKSANISQNDAAVQLFQCASEQLGDAVLRLENNVSTKSEKELLDIMRSLAVIPVALMVIRAELFAMRQNREESFRSFFARVRGKADICSYTTESSCQCGRTNNVDFTETIVRDIVVAGIYDEDIRRRIMGMKDLCRKSANDIVSLVETEEMARDSVSQSISSSASAKATVQTVPRMPTDEQNKRLPCPHCKKPFNQFKKGRYGWNKKPHSMCNECYRAQRSGQAGTREVQTNNSTSVSQVGSLSKTNPKNAAHHHKRMRNPCEVAPVHLSHHIFTKGEWKKAEFMKHPTVRLTISVDQDHYSSFGLKSPRVRDKTVECIADTGAQSNLWSWKKCKEMGFSEKDLIPVNSSLVAANKSRIDINGAIVVTLRGKKDDGSIVSCSTMVYISSSVHSFYLCHESMIDLGIIPYSFPTVGDTLKQTISSIATDSGNPAPSGAHGCSCPRRETVPPRPSQLPVKCTPENIAIMREWLLKQFASSTFNTCPHQPLPCMVGPPIEMHLDSTATPRVCHTPATVPLHWQEKVKSDLERDVALGVIEKVPYGEPVTWCHRMVVTRKHDGTPRRTVDLSPLNKFCKRETFVTESPFHLARKIPGGTWKTVSDAWNGYHSVPLKDTDRHLTTFITPFGRFRYKRAPQGFVSSGDGYNRRFDAILADFIRKERCVDDTIHYDVDLEEHWWRTIDFLRKVGEAGIVLNPKKFQFCKKSVDFAGFHVGESIIEPLPKYLDAIRDFPTPKNITDIRSWFGLVNQVANYAQLREVMAPFRPFLSPKNTFQWSTELETAFQQSKDAIVTAIIKGVEIFDLAKKTCLRPDWSRQGIGYFLLQKHCQCSSDLPDCCMDGWRIVLAGSRFLSAAEQRYAPIEGEALAVAWGLEQSKYFSQGCEDLIVVTDHKPLVKILGDRTLDEITNTRLFRLKQRTLPWRFSIAHLPGKTNHAADATSRNPSPRINDYAEDISHALQSSSDEAEVCHVTSITDDVSSTFSISWSELKAATATDPTLDRLLFLVENGFPESRSNLPEDLAAYWNVRNSLYVHDGVIMYNDRVVVPISLRRAVMTMLHSAHQGVTMMMSRANAIVYWPGMAQDLKNVRDSCLQCCRNAPSQPATPAVSPIIPSTPFECIVADFFESHGHQYLVVADRLSGWVEIFSSPSKSFGSSASGLVANLRNFFRIFGVPEELSSDGGPQFKATITEEFLSRWGIRHRVSSAYFPQSNGRAEVAVKTAKRLLIDNIGSSGSLDTDRFLRAILQLRNTPDPDCHVSPAEIVFGRPLRDAFAFVSRTEKFQNPNVHPMWRDAWKSKETALRTRFTRTMESLNLRARSLAPLSCGDRVFVQNQKGMHPNKWDRSGVVMESQGNDQYLVKIDGTGRLTVRNRRFLRLYTPASPTITYPSRSLTMNDDSARSITGAERRYTVSDSTNACPEDFLETSPSAQDEPAPTPLTYFPPLPENTPVDNPRIETPENNMPETNSEPTPDQHSRNDSSPLINHRPRRERKQPKLYDAHSGAWITP